MKATRRLHEPGQSLWLDNVTRGLRTGEAQIIVNDALAAFLQQPGIPVKTNVKETP